MKVRSTFRKAIVKWAVLIPAFLALLWVLPGCQKQQTPGQRERPAPAVTVEDVRTSESWYTVHTTGMVEAWKEARLSFQVAGRIATQPPEEGAGFSSGQALAGLDQADYRAQLEAARYLLELAGVEADRTKADLERCEKLFAEGAVSRQTLENAGFASRAAGARAGQASSTLKQAELAVDHCTLTAPFEGVVLKKLFQEGEMVGAGVPVLVLSQLNPVKVAVIVPAGQAQGWTRDTEVWIVPEKASIAGNNDGGQGVRAVVNNVSPGAEGLTGSFRVELKVENPGRHLRPGQVVSVSRRAKTGNGLWIPVKSVVSRGEDLKYVFVLDPDGATARLRPVKLGPVAGDRIEAASGLNPGDSVLVLMPADLRDGDRVEVKKVGNN